MIYFIRTDDPDIDRIKIGYTSSDDAEQRLKTLQTGSPCKLYIMAIMPYGSLQQEAALHKTFDDYNVIGEWFEVTEGLMAFISNFAEPLATREEEVRTEDIYRQTDGVPAHARLEIGVNGYRRWRWQLKDENGDPIIFFDANGNKRYKRGSKYVPVTQPEAVQP